MSLWKCCTCGATERSHLRAPELCLLCGGNRFDCVEYRPDFRRVRAELARGNVGRIKHSDIRACPHTILVAAHYREDGSCKCDNLEERQKMIREWGYKQSDFKGIPLRVWA